MKVEGKIKIGDVAYILLILICLLFMIISSIGGWWYMNYTGFTPKQLIINLIVSSSTLFMIWVIFNYIFIFKIKRHSRGGEVPR
jgi:hypothetical protein